MTPDKVIYTNGRDVVVTDAAFKVRNTLYRLNGITKLCLWTIRPERWPGILLLLVGIAALVCGFINLFPATLNVETENGEFSANMLAMWIGAGLVLIGIIGLAMSKDRYAVRIGTAEGEKNAVVSYSREYISQIVDALHSAFDMGSSDIPITERNK